MSYPFGVLIPYPSQFLPLLAFLITFTAVFLISPHYVYLTSSRGTKCFKFFNLCRENGKSGYRILVRFKNADFKLSLSIP